MEIGLVQRIDIDREMQQAYLDYAMSVIVARALPDARDGLKPVHRRILYAMYDMGLRPDSPYKKSARIVGEVLGKYHPHGDAAVYEAMARMAQDFSMRVPLVDGQGNFGSVDGDPPAAMRYTEARLAAPAQHLLADIQKSTVDFDPNFDDTLREPRVLPAAMPNLLVNGATGIAVGMSTNIPPHNLGEVVDALRHMLDNWEKLDDIAQDDLMKFIQGPDFPTGGVIIQGSPGNGSEGSLASAYGTGRGQVIVQARAHLEEMERGKNRIIVTELPYMTNKASLIERIAELAREERLEGLVDLRDESDRQGMRIVIELSKNADPEKVLADLYKHTPMQSTFSIIMLALVDGEPRLLSLKQALRVYLDHRLEIVRRRSEFDLEKARARAQVLEGLRVALKNLDEVIDMIRKAPDVETARVRLMKRFRLSEIQAQAILDMQLRRLAALERKKIEEEYKEVQAQIKELEALLRSPKKMRQVVGDELLAVREAYGERRRTQIVSLKNGEHKKSLLTIEDLAPEKTAWLVITPDGLVTRTLDDKLPRQSGSDAPAFLLRVTTRDTLYLACEQGETAALPVHAAPETDKPAEGVPYHKLSALKPEQRLAAVFSLPPKSERLDNWHVLTVTRQGMLKKTAVSELPGPSANTFTLVKVNEGDRLGWARLTDGKSELLLLTAGGMSIRFNEDEVRPMGLAAAGVMGIKLASGDEVVGAEILPPPTRGQAGEIFLAASDGSAKRVALDQFPRQGRYGQGVVAWKLPGQVRAIGMAVGKGSDRVTFHLDKLAPKMVRLDEAPLQGRAARGKSILGLKPGDRLLSLVVAREPKRPASAALKSGEPSRDVDEPRVETAAPKARAVRRPSAAKTSPGKAAPARKAAAAKPTGKPAAKQATKPAAKAPAARKAAPARVAAKTSAAPAPSKAAPAKTARAKPAATKPVPAKASPAPRKPAKAKAVPAVKTTATKARAASTGKTKAAASAKAKAAPAPKTKAASTATTARGSTARRAKTSTSPATPRPSTKKPASPAPAKRGAAKPTSTKSGAAKPGVTKPAAGKAQLELPLNGVTPPPKKRSGDKTGKR